MVAPYPWVKFRGLVALKNDNNYFEPKSVGTSDDNNYFEPESVSTSDCSWNLGKLITDNFQALEWDFDQTCRLQQYRCMQNPILGIVSCVDCLEGVTDLWNYFALI